MYEGMRGLVVRVPTSLRVSSSLLVAALCLCILAEAWDSPANSLPADAASRDLAGTWSHGNRLVTRGQLVSVSCGSATFCVAVSSTGSTYVYRGDSWSPGPSVTGPAGGPLTSVSCSSATVCAAVGGDATFGFNGSVWSLHGHAGHLLTAVSCPLFGTACDAVSRDGWLFGGGQGSGSKLPGLTGAKGISCTPAGSPTLCEEVAQHGRISGPFGDSKASLVLGSGTLSAISCPSSKGCIAVGTAGAAFEYSYSKTAWLPMSRVGLSNRINLTSVSCPTVSTGDSFFCLAVSDDGSAFRYDGHRWFSQKLAQAGTTDLVSVSCANLPDVGTNLCAAVSRDGRAFIYRMGSGG
jgi:hypothetical protein